MSMLEYDKLRGRRRIAGSAVELPDSVAGQIEALAELDDEVPDMENKVAHGART
jgi:hypothetical protein